MSYNRNSDEVLENELSVYAKGNPNQEFCQQMADALVRLGAQEALSCMARFMVVIAKDQGVALEFNCDLGKVAIEPKELPSRH